MVAETPGDGRCLYFFQEVWDGLFLVLEGDGVRLSDDRRLFESTLFATEPLRITHRLVVGFLIWLFLQLFSFGIVLTCVQEKKQRVIDAWIFSCVCAP